MRDAVKVNVLGSSSKGNCYLLDSGDEVLIVEAGVRFSELKKALAFNLRRVVGCLVSHEHNDHAKYIKNVVESGIRTLALGDVWRSKGITHGAYTVDLDYERTYRFGGFRVKAFPACHDVPCAGFFIEHPDSGRILFLTDSCSCDYVFPKLRYVMIECNYSYECLYRAISEGRTRSSQEERLMLSHMELASCRSYLESLDLSEVEGIVLLHLSDQNSDERVFVRQVSAATGKYVCAARPGMVMEL